MSANDIDVLARTLFGESTPNSPAEATAIASVVVNRTKHRQWPKTIAGVCQQPWQFSCWNQSDPNRERILAANGVTSKWFAKCKEIAAAADAGKIADATRGATHYYAKTMKRAPKWAKGKTPCHTTDGHLFFNDIDTPAPTTAKEALDQVNPLSRSKTIQGQTVVGGGVALGGLVEALQQVQSGVEPLVPYLDTLKFVFLGAALIGVGLTVWARVRDRADGLK